jgi:hypothetical protein
MPAALAAFKNKAARPLFQEQLEQSRRRDMQVGGDPISLQRKGLIRPTPGNERKRRSDGTDDLILFLPEFGRNKPQYAHPPWAVAKSPSGLFEEGANLWAAQQGQG